MSLRSFARYLGVPAPTLSHVLNGKRKLSVKAALKLSKRLGLSEDLNLLILDDAIKNQRNLNLIRMERYSLEEISEKAVFLELFYMKFVKIL